MIHTGTVKRFNKIKGYGFIEADANQQEVFVHFSDVDASGYKELHVGDRVSYHLNQGERGEFATYVKIIK